MTDTSNMTEAELADYYDRTHDLSEFEGVEFVPITPGRRDSIVSVRFAPGELDVLDQRAEAAGMKLTAFIRAAALSEAHPVDLDRLQRAVTRLLKDGAAVGEVLRFPTGTEQVRRTTARAVGRSFGAASGGAARDAAASKAGAKKTVARTTGVNSAAAKSTTKTASGKALSSKGAVAKAATTSKSAASRSARTKRPRRRRGPE